MTMNLERDRDRARIGRLQSAGYLFVDLQIEEREEKRGGLERDRNGSQLENRCFDDHVC